MPTKADLEVRISELSAELATTRERNKQLFAENQVQRRQLKELQDQIKEKDRLSDHFRDLCIRAESKVELALDLARILRQT